ncbi:hypothetical protein BHM03_00034957 [Ensete ventricosum]|nr:hypothetical protein BHM03_00034957 [Ensete ventricosum]
MLPGHLSKESRKFESIFKISRKTFNYICSLVRDDLMARTSNFAFTDGKTLSLEDQVAIGLRRLSSGESLLNIGVSFGMNHSTVSQVTWRFVEAMEERGIHHLKWPTSPEMEDIKSKFEEIQGLPNCCGAIDTTHIMMCLPSVDATNKVWVDYEKKHSMVLQAVVDPDLRFRDIITGWPGSMNEVPVLQSSGFFKMCEKGTRLNGEKVELPEKLEVREYIIGDSGFPLLPWLLTPYQGKDLSDAKIEFNKRLSGTRMVAQRALARLKGRKLNDACSGVELANKVVDYTSVLCDLEEEEEEEEEVACVNMANVLLLLSQGRSGGGTEEIDYVVQSSERVFECRTCNRQFPSFQALGGHRASHKKPRLDGHGQAQAKRRVHECRVRHRTGPGRPHEAAQGHDNRRLRPHPGGGGGAEREAFWT